MLWISVPFTIHKNHNNKYKENIHILFCNVHLLYNYIIIYLPWVLKWEYFPHCVLVFILAALCSMLLFASHREDKLFREVFVLKYRKHLRTSFQSVMCFFVRLCDKYLKSNSCFCQLYLYFVTGVTFATLTPVYISLFIMAMLLGSVCTERNENERDNVVVVGTNTNHN